MKGREPPTERGAVTVDRFLKNPCARARVRGVSIECSSLPCVEVRSLSWPTRRPVCARRSMTADFRGKCRRCKGRKSEGFDGLTAQQTDGID